MLSYSTCFQQQQEKGPYQHLDLRQYIPDNMKTGLTDTDLVIRPTKDLNKLLKSTGKSEIWVLSNLMTIY